VSEPKRYPENAAGPFYVEADLCIACRSPEAVAPNLVAANQHHCYFKKQPQTAEEMEQAIRAVEHCCCGAYRYAGHDPNVMTRLGSDACDRWTGGF
jgi:ferredoxin